MAERVNYYRVLGVERNASQSEIKNAYRRLAKERHPDHAGGSEAEFARLQEANAVLSDPNRRRQHDQDLDLAHAADQLADLDLDFGSLDEDEVSRKRREKESQGGTTAGSTLGERLRGRFRRRERPEEPTRGRGRGRSRAPQREARWYEPHDFDPDPVTWRTGAFSFLGTLFALLVAGQLGLWAIGAVDPGVLAPVSVLAPFMPLIYILVGLVSAYLSYRAAGWAGVALVFVAALVIGNSGGPVGLVQSATLGIALLLVVIYLGNRRDAARRNRR